VPILTDPRLAEAGRATETALAAVRGLGAPRDDPAWHVAYIIARRAYTAAYDHHRWLRQYLTALYPTDILDRAEALLADAQHAVPEGDTAPPER
jgi:hypothetical protein